MPLRVVCRSPCYGLDAGDAAVYDGLDGALQSAMGNAGGRKLSGKIKRCAARAAKAGLTVTRRSPGDWPAMDEHARLARQHVKSHNGFLCGIVVRAVYAFGMIQWKLAPQHLVEWRLPDGSLVAFCTLLVVGRTLIGGCYAVNPSYSRTRTNLWQSTIHAALTLMAEEDCAVCNCMPSYGDAKMASGLRPIPLRRALDALWELPATARLDSIEVVKM